MKLLNLKYAIAILAIFCCLSIQKAKAQVNTQDSLALVDLYDSTGGPNWTNHTNWLTKAPVSSWYGITVNASNRVIKINFLNNKLSGNLPASLGNLINLQILHIGNSRLIGNIPFSFTNLTNLTFLSLENNLLTGAIPDIFTNMPKLYNLNISLNKLSGNFPASIANLSSLIYLAFAYNKLSGTIPNFISNLTNLQYIYLFSNQLSGNIPTSIGNLTGLQVLSLYNNQLSGNIPVSIGNLTKLVNIDLDANNLSGSIPESIGNLSSLETLDFSGNQLSGNIPAAIMGLSALKYMSLYHNNLSGSIPTSIQNLNKLVALNLGYNQLTGTIPYLSNNTSIKRVYLGNNQFTFDGMEAIANPTFADSIKEYSPQAIIPISQNGNLLSVSAGGTPNNNTYKWYQNGNLVATNVGDSTYTVISNAQYKVVVTNAVATSLTLNSNTVTISNLPVTLSSFTAYINNKSIQTNWHTSTELNIGHFIIQRGTDGSSFTDIGTVKAFGSGANGYQFTDNTPTIGINYYRLKSVDKDGGFAYSKVVSVQFTVNSNQLSVFPNPSKDKVTVLGIHIVSVQVVDNLGRVLKIVSFKDASNPTLTFSGMPAGIYHLRVQTTDGKVSGVGFVKK